MVELGTRRTTERVRVGHSPPTVARAVILPDDIKITIRGVAVVFFPRLPDQYLKYESKMPTGNTI